MKISMFLACIAMAILAGCAGPQHMNNDEIIAEALKCEQADLQWRQTYNYDGTIKEVQCTPRFPLRRQ